MRGCASLAHGQMLGFRRLGSVIAKRHLVTAVPGCVHQCNAPRLQLFPYPYRHAHTNTNAARASTLAPTSWSWLAKGGLLAGTIAGVLIAQIYLFESSYVPLPEFQGRCSGVIMAEPNPSSVSNPNSTLNPDAICNLKRIAVLGDSLVTGVGGDMQAAGPALPRLLAQFISDKKGVNVEWHAFGKTGVNLKQLRNEVFPALLQKIMQLQQQGQTLDAVVIVCGLNDWKRIYKTYTTPQKFKQELQQLITVLQETCKNDKLEVYLPALPVMWTSFSHPLKDVVCYVASLWDDQKKKLSETLQHVKFIESPPASLLNPSECYLSSDGVHPNERGYVIWCKHMATNMW